MSSPNINNMIILGCICCYLSAILYGLDTAIVSEAVIPNVCNVSFSITIFCLCKFKSKRYNKGRKVVILEKHPVFYFSGLQKEKSSKVMNTDLTI